jgi:hypothetical protein
VRRDGGGETGNLPTALPTDQAMKFRETATDFLVWPATFLGCDVSGRSSSWNIAVGLPGQQTHAETLGSPEGEHNVVAE